ncbi:LysR family transcriptional regulator [Streptomyces sp. GC420]|uniref:LysR family transcriptional regulator n=1 Tax=Streptomyces sp. GC420 TaxID=2697568 RepID=UPI001414DA8A|nr:LysR family transcriptional regulator [Streptomyces sp. GC420]NBM16628.1 LysR family transcriptional regulator [Streptomyces sp. GC420]
MELRVLEYFLSVVDLGSVTAASQEVHVTQPSLSRQIRQLEHELGLTLFRRGEGALRLTPAGRAFLPVARDLIARSRLAKDTARSMASGAGVPLTVIAPPTTVTDVVAPFVVASGPPGQIVDVVEASPHGVYTALAIGQADFAIGTRPPGSDLEYTVLGQAPVWAQMAPGHPWADRDHVDLTDISTGRVIVMDELHGVRRVLDEAAAKAGLGYDAAYVARAPAVAQALAAAGKGVCILSDDPRFGLRSLPIRLTDGLLHVTLFGAWDPTHYAASQIRACLDELAEFCRGLFAAVH